MIWRAQGGFPLAQSANQAGSSHVAGWSEIEDGQACSIVSLWGSWPQGVLGASCLGGSKRDVGRSMESQLPTSGFWLWWPLNPEEVLSPPCALLGDSSGADRLPDWMSPQASSSRVQTCYRFHRFLCPEGCVCPAWVCAWPGVPFLGTTPLSGGSVIAVLDAPAGVWPWEGRSVRSCAALRCLCNGCFSTGWSAACGKGGGVRGPFLASPPPANPIPGRKETLEGFQGQEETAKKATALATSGDCPDLRRELAKRLCRD